MDTAFADSRSPFDAVAEDGGQSVAIIGMSGRFPGASSVGEFWENSRAGRDSIPRFSDDELEDAFSASVRASPDYVPARPYLADADRFDADFFGMFPREAALTDPQFRVFLEICWEALEDAGRVPFGSDATIGVVAGCSMSTYFLHNVLSDRSQIEEFTSTYQVQNYPMLVGALTDTLATRVAYKLDLKGPAFTVHTACSTSLLAVAQACQSLVLYQSDMMLAGGVSITFPQKRGYLHQEGGMVSPDGKCRPFDAAAGGTVFGSGAGVVLLKRLDDALADGDPIYAVIRGCGVNNDGSDKIGFTAPSVRGQAAAIAAAHAQAGIDAASIGYVECHGTATPLGDPIEFKGLLEAFGAAPRAGCCAIGSAKANVGHLDAAAGITGLIRATMALRDRQIPPLAHFSRPNPHISAEGSPFYFPTSLSPWQNGRAPRRAGVSSFGIGGTNVHVVLEEAPEPAARASQADAGPQILPVSARSVEAVRSACAALAARFEAAAELRPEDVACTLQRGRQAFAHRAAVVASTGEGAAAGLRSPAILTGVASKEVSGVCFLFPGQGAQYPGMARGLYGRDREFTRWVDRGCDILRQLLDRDLRSLLFTEGGDEATSAALLRETRVTQPALFLVEYALAKAWIARGVTPQAMIGHSVGEFVAAALADVMSFEDALRLVVSRGCMMNARPGGSMLSVRAPADAVLGFLAAGVDLAAVNAPNLCVVAGTGAAVDALERRLADAGIATSRLQTSHAFHSAMMDPVVAELRLEAGRIAFRPPQIPYVSCVSGTWITAEEACSADYWSVHCRATVDFAGAVATLCEDGKPVLLEVGPGRTLSTFAAQTLGRDGAGAVVQSLSDHRRQMPDEQAMAEAFARLWLAGVDVDWSLGGAADGRRVSLPTYPFERKRYWIEPPLPGRGEGRAAAQSPLQQPTASPQASLDRSREDLAMTARCETPVGGRVGDLRERLRGTIEDLSGATFAEGDAQTTFLDLGFDSLFLGQLAQKLQKDFGVKLTFRQLLGDLPSVAALADHLAAVLPEAPAAAPAAGPVTSLGPTADPTVVAGPPADPAGSAFPDPAPPGAGIERLFQSQLQVMQQVFAQQMQALQHRPGAVAAPISAPSVPPPLPSPEPSGTVDLAAKAPAPEADGPSRFRMYQPGAAKTAAHTDTQRAFIADLTQRYCARNRLSKEYTEAHRGALADPRAVAGFRAEWKELIFPVVASRSKGSKIWDVDGNEYVDLVNGYGQTAFGHAPDFILEAVSRQMADGFAIGPQAPLAGEVADLISALTGHERVTFCNTGSEAVMAAMRVARAVTGRERVVVFANDYHGQFDEVLVKGRMRGALPAAAAIAPGIPAASVSNITVLPYGDPRSLEWIAENGADIAAVVFEPVQSRHPELQPVDFVRSLRRVTAEHGIALVFDEVVTGFRVHAGGIQALWGIRGDMATYGKVVGGGMPIGILAGSRTFMDALDGGSWRFGDDTVPEVAPTFFAGTFVRHPLALAAAHAVLKHLQENGAELHDRVAARTASLVRELNEHLAARGIAGRIQTFSSWFMIDFSATDRNAPLFFAHMRLLGVHVQDGFPSFLTTAHGEADFRKIADAFRQSVDALQAAGFMLPSGEGDDATPHRADEGRNAREAAMPAAGDVPLTEAQTEIWLAAQLGDDASCAFNESVSLRLTGPLDVQALGEALTELVARHDSLRLRFAKDGRTFRVTSPERFEPVYVEQADGPGPGAALQAVLDDHAETPFDLTHGLPIRAHLVRLSEAEHVLVLTAHHIVCDGWSINVLMEELAALYSARLDHAAPALPEIYAFSRFAGERIATDRDSRTEAYWLDQFADLPPLPELPLDRPRPERRSFRGATATAHIDGETCGRVRKAGAREGCTLFVVLFSALQVLIGRLSGKDDIVLGVPTAGQSLVEDRVLTGHCVNFLPIRARFDAGRPFAEHLSFAKRQVLDAFENQQFTYGTLVRKLGIRRDSSRLPLTEIQFNLERIADRLGFRSLEATLTPNGKAFTNFDLFFNVIEGAGGLRIDVDFNSDIFDRETVEGWLEQYRTLLSAIADDTARIVGELPLLSDARRRWLEQSLNDTARAYPQDLTVHALVTATAAGTPDAVAARHGGAEITYAELERRSNRLARFLREAVPGAPGRIAVAMDRSLDMLVALLAVLKSGNAYVPLDIRHPADRLNRILGTAAVSALVCDREDMAALASGAGVLAVRLDLADQAIGAMSEAAPEQATGGDRSAYVIFTSGSTGEPKGVEISHHAVVNFLLSMAERPGFTAKDVLVAVTTVSFDIAALELFLPLACGGSVVIADQADISDGFALVRLIDASRASVVQATPTLWSMLIEAGLKPHAGLTMLCGGEPLPRHLADALLAGGGALWNMYGPTETTIWSSAAPVGPGAGPIGIGNPIHNTRLYIVDEREALVPPGVVGELCIAGDGLAKGYFSRPDLTDKAFRTIRLAGGDEERIYRTGDLARRMPDGALVLLGRRDDQVKLRGFRLELGEIETAVAQYPGIAASAVALKVGASGDEQLVGYYTVRDGREITGEELGRHVGALLPNYMTPTAWMRLEALPATANGKLDRKALPLPHKANVAPVRLIQPPANALEETLHEIWSDVLKIRPIGTHDDIFGLGADSLNIFRIAARMLDRGLDLEAKHLMTHPTIAELAAFAALRKADGAAPASSRPSLKDFRHGRRREKAVLS